MTVGYLLHYLKPFYAAWDDALADELVRQFDLPRNRRLRHLSRGMRMKAALASSLAYRPELIVLDELVHRTRRAGASGIDPGPVGAGRRHHHSDQFRTTSPELESFASHIGYVRGWQPESFHEEMSALSERFRQVEVIFEAPPAIPREWPAAWTPPQTALAVIRFVDRNFDREPHRSAGDPPPVSGRAQHQPATPMALKDIFIALAMASRQSCRGLTGAHSMRQALHILRKDIRHGLPAIGMVLAATVLFAR